MRAQFISLFLGILLTACSMLTACGTKGPLYIPEQRYPQASSVKPNTTPNVDKSSKAPRSSQQSCALTN